MNLTQARFVSLPNGGKLAYRVSGPSSGAPILLLRPLGGSMALWSEFAAHLELTLRVVSFDPLGVGQSSDVPFFHSTRQMAHDAIALLDHLQIERCHVFGLSLGGMVASWLALDHPARMGRIVLASTIPEASALSPRGLPQLVRFARCILRSGANAEIALLRGILSAHFRNTQEARISEIEQLLRATPSKRSNLASLVLAAARHDARLDALPAHLHVLLLYGALDLLAGLHARIELLQKVRNATMEIVPDAGHDLSLEAPKATAERVLKFVDATR